MLCLLCLLCLVLPTRCCAADLKAHHTVRAAFLSIHADGDGDGDCRRCLEQLTIYKYCPLFLSVRCAVFQIANLGKGVPTGVAFLGEKELGFPFFDQKKVPGTPGA